MHKREFYSFEQWCIDNDRNDLMELWDYELNCDKPSTVSFRSNKKYYFKCPRGIHESKMTCINSLVGTVKHINCNACNSFGQYLIDTYGNDAIDKYWGTKTVSTRSA